MASRRKSSSKNASEPEPELLAEAEQALQKLGNLVIDFDDMYRSREDELEQLRALRGSPDDFVKYRQSDLEQLVPRLATRLDDPLRVAIERASKLRGNAARLLEYADAVAKSVASTALLEPRAGRHHILELLSGPLSEAALRDLHREVPEPPELMTDAAFAYHLYKWSLPTFKEVVPLVKGKEPAEALAIVRKKDPQLADWIEAMDDEWKSVLLPRLVQQKAWKKVGKKEKKSMTLQRHLALLLGGAILDMEPTTFENRVVNRREPKEPSPRPRRRRPRT
jgi:hypothetical protein